MPVQYYTLYGLNQGDTLQSIARSQLGDASRWKELAELNRLRYPYISDDPADQYGQEMGQYSLNQDLPTNSGFVALDANQGTRIRAGYTVYFEELISGGNKVSEAYEVKSYNHVSGVIEFDGQTSFNFHAESLVRIFQNQFDITTKVLKTGDVLRIPGKTTLDENFVLDQEQFMFLLGEDFRLDGNGNMFLEDGDLQTVKGSDNLVQALRDRWNTEPGELTYHEDYGNRVLTSLGELNATYFHALAKVWLRLSALQDPRIADVQNVVVRAEEDRLLVENADVKIFNTSVLLKVSNLILSTGVA
ncbi:MAG: baseplate family protein [Bacillota bacterium]